MDDGTFGGGLSFGDGGYVVTPPAGPGGSGADVPPTSLAPPGAAPNAQAEGPAPQAPAPSFGQSLRSILPGPNYRAPDPQTTALDQTADMLDQRIQRANSVAANPILQFFNPEGVQAARAFIPQATEQLQKIKAQKADMQANRQQAATLGLAPGEVPDEASQADREEVAKAKALSGDLKVFKGYQAVNPKGAEAIQDQVYETVGGHLTKAQLAFDSLSGMQNQGQYEAKLNQLRKDGTLTDLEALGLKVPGSFDAFSAAKGREGQALREARIGVDTIRQKLEERNTYQPMEEKEAKTYNGRLTTVHGDQITNGTWARNGSSNARGLIVNGAADPRELGKSFTLATPEQRKGIKEEFDGAVSKANIDKYREFNRTYELATKDGKGNPMPEGKINTNPNVQQGIAEGLASMLRGGGGGATSGLLNIESSKRAFVQTLLDKITANYAGGINALKDGADPSEVKPYLTNLTQGQMRDVMDALKSYNDTDMSGRVSTIANRAGALGLDPAALGLGKGEAAGAISEAMEAGRQAQIARMSPNHQAIGGGDGVFQLGAQRPGAGATGTPAGTEATNQLPGAQPLQTPVQQSQNPQAPVPPPAPGGGTPPAVPTQPAPAATQPPGAPGPAGGGTPAPAAPLTVAGQQVNVPLPQGVSPNFVPALQRIESGRNKDPWTATAGNGPNGKPLSSASGAFQMIDKTWNDNKPAGAPDRAKDATPAQQSQAFATLIAKNAQTLTANGLPVNDTSLYVAHNLGATGASTLMKADPNADARTVIGETAAKNNPLFFRGKPTVATVLQRYQAEMDKTPAPDDGGPGPRPGAGGATAEAPGLMTRISRMLSAGVPGDGAAKDKAVADVGRTAVEHAPAIGSTIGAAGGSLAGPAGTVAGGAAGGGAGQAFKDYMQGRPQNPTEIGKQAALGGVLGVASEARPVLAAAARVGGSGAVEGGAKAIEGGDAGDIADAALTGGAYALGGEALGRFISAAGPAAHKLFSKFTPDAQAELSAQAGKLVEARKVLATEQPKLAGEAGGPNPKFEAAKKTEEEASQYIKDHGQKPDDMAYAYEQTKAGTSAGEALTMRKANSEKAAVSEGYDQLRSDVREATPGQKNLKPQSVPDGPVSMLRTAENPTGKVPEAFRADAEHAEMLVTAPAKDWGAKWQQLQDAGSELIKKRMAFLANNDKPSAEAMNSLFEGVRNQQKAAAKIVFGEKRGQEVISHLQDLDKRYAKVMNATQGMNFEKMRSVIQSGNTAERRELEANFKEFAKDDPSALRAFNAMKAGAKGRMGEEAKLMIPVIAGEFAANASGIPTVGAISAAIGGHRMYALLKEYMNAKLLGKPVTFRDFAVKAVKDYQHGAVNAAGSAAQRAVVMR